MKQAMKGLDIFSASIAGFRFLKEGMLECPPLDRPIAGRWVYVSLIDSSDLKKLGKLFFLIDNCCIIINQQQ